MTDYKLVPVELLRGWHERINTIAVETAFDVADEMEAMLSTSPDVQGEPDVSTKIRSISHGTMRHADLIPAFANELATITSHEQALNIVGFTPNNTPTDDDGFWDTVDAADILKSLIDALDSVAPTGCYFGAHPGDESNYGFWMIEELRQSNPPEQVEPVAWSGWGCQHPGKMPRLYGERRIAELNCDWESGDQVLYFTAAPRSAEQHPDDASVDRFATAMKAKLAKKRDEGRGGWQGASAEYLSQQLRDHVDKGDPVDVANLAMMLHQNGQRIEQQLATDVAGLVEALEEIEQWVSRWCADDHPVVKFARKALAAHRKQGGEV